MIVAPGVRQGRLALRTRPLFITIAEVGWIIVTVIFMDVDCAGERVGVVLQAPFVFGYSMAFIRPTSTA